MSVTETVHNLIPISGEWFATVDDRHVKVAAWAVVEITDVLDPEVGYESWRVIRAVTPGCENETAPLSDVHPIEECSAHESSAPIPMRRRGVA